jgi:hypothetical protein
MQPTGQGFHPSSTPNIMMKELLTTAAVCLVTLGAAAQTPLPYFQDFEGGVFPPPGWQTFPIGSPVNWTLDTVSAYGIGTACASFDNYNTASGYYGIRLPWMDFTNVENAVFQFDLAYAKRPTGSADQFSLWWSDNGSTNWQSLGSISAITAPPTADPFVPESSQWQTFAVVLSLSHEPYVRLAIEDVSNHGNLMYFDNALVYDSLPSGVVTAQPAGPVIAPNPFNTQITVTGVDAVAAELVTTTGSTLVTSDVRGSSVVLDGLEAAPAGVYVLRLYAHDGTTVNSVVMKL